MSESSSAITSGTLSSAGAGAAMGMAVGGPIGALIGAGIGAIVGSVGGALTGNKASKAKKYLRKAQAVKVEREENSAYDNYLQYIREARIARAQTVQAAANRGVGTSSLFGGGVSGISSQVAYTTQYAAEDWRLNQLYNHYMELAQKNAAKAEDFAGYHQALNTAVSTVAMVAGAAGSFSGSTPLKGDFWQANPGASTFDLSSLNNLTNVGV